MIEVGLAIIILFVRDMTHPTQNSRVAGDPRDQDVEPLGGLGEILHVNLKTLINVRTYIVGRALGVPRVLLYWAMTTITTNTDALGCKTHWFAWAKHGDEDVFSSLSSRRTAIPIKKTPPSKKRIRLYSPSTLNPNPTPGVVEV